MGFGTLAKATPAKTWSLLGFVGKYWYWIGLILFLLPAIINAISIGVKTDNPTYPLFALGTTIVSADQVLEEKVSKLSSGNVTGLVGMERPAEGLLWSNFVYHWKWFWNVPFCLLGLVYTIFLPLVIIYKLIKGRNTSTPYKNLALAMLYFMIYLVFINTVIVIYGLADGNSLIDIPDGIDKFVAFKIIVTEMIPLHGIVKLSMYFIQLAVGIAPNWI